jgi:hypothetical protein
LTKVIFFPSPDNQERIIITTKIMMPTSWLNRLTGPVAGQTQVPILVPKKKVKKKKPVEAPVLVNGNGHVNGEERVHVTPAAASSEVLKTLEEVMMRVVPTPAEEKPVDNAAHEYRKLVNMMHEIERRIGGLTKNQPLRKQLVMQLTQIKDRLAVLKPEYRKYINNLEQMQNEQPIRSDGSVNYVAAILHLLKKTEQQQKEIEELKNAVAFLSAS